jgi:hypothetical protein
MKSQKRPESLAEVATQSTTEDSFGRNLADFEHELLRLSSRKGLASTIAARPRILAQVFATGAIGDAWLAAYTEELAFRFDLAYPDWLWESERFLETPYIHDAHSPELKVWHTLKSPAAFSRRNLFVDFHLPAVRLRRGRPCKTAAHKREMNRRRVARHRVRSSPARS